LLFGCAKDPFDDPEYARVCAGPPVHGSEERQAAAEQGYEISTRFDCVTRESKDTMDLINAAVAGERAKHQEGQAAPRATLPAVLSEARRGFVTRVSVPGAGAPYPAPPAELFVRSDYASDGRTLAAFVSPDPRDGEKHAAIVWLTGGDSSTLDDFWSEGPADSDQSASAFREAGIVMMFPTLRGGNQNEGSHEYFYGEVDDVIAAGNQLAKLPYVDPGQIYLGGHSTGGTLVLLAAETTSRFKAVFAFGAVASIDRYPESLLPGIGAMSREEINLRSPVHWLNNISTPTWVIEGEESPGNLAELQSICMLRSSPQLHCVAVAGRNHFSVLAPVTRVLAARIIGAMGGRPVNIDAADFAVQR
jgi:pimeloyl-ACP methyl ester carboxylesterase